MTDARATTIDGRETWWAVCCQSECESVYIGPFFDLEACERECNIDTCYWAHFVARYVPPFAEVIARFDAAIDAADLSIDEVIRWGREHNTTATRHPLYRSRRDSDEMDHITVTAGDAMTDAWPEREL